MSVCDAIGVSNVGCAMLTVQSWMCKLATSYDMFAPALWYQRCLIFTLGLVEWRCYY